MAVRPNISDRWARIQQAIHKYFTIAFEIAFTTDLAHKNFALGVQGQAVCGTELANALKVQAPAGGPH